MKQPACADTFLWVYMNRFCFFGSFHQICFNALYGVFFYELQICFYKMQIIFCVKVDCFLVKNELFPFFLRNVNLIL